MRESAPRSVASSDGLEATVGLGEEAALATDVERGLDPLVEVGQGTPEQVDELLLERRQRGVLEP